MVLSPKCLFGSSWNSWTSEFHSQLIATLTDDFFLEMSFISQLEKMYSFFKSCRPSLCLSFWTLAALYLGRYMVCYQIVNSRRCSKVPCAQMTLSYYLMDECFGEISSLCAHQAAFTFMQNVHSNIIQCSQKWKKCPETGKWINKIWHILLTQYYYSGIE